MANPSDAYGTITFIPTNDNHDDTLMRCIMRLNDTWAYGNLTDPCIDDHNPEDITMPFTSDFVSEGRWALNTTMKNFFETIDHTIDYEVNTGEMSIDLADELLKRIDGLEFKTSFVDHEPGYKVLYKAILHVKAKLKDGKLISNVLSCEEEDIPYTKDNLAKYQY